MFSRMTITLSEDERVALVQMAGNEFRRPQEQLRYILRTEAQKRGFLNTHERTPEPTKHQGALVRATDP
jgi:hypothetical protein